MVGGLELGFDKVCGIPEGVWLILGGGELWGGFGGWLGVNKGCGVPEGVWLIFGGGGIVGWVWG